MNEIRSIPHVNNENPAIRFDSLAVKLQLKVYRACWDGMAQITSLAWNVLSPPLNQYVLQKVRKYDVVDFVIITTLKVANGSYSAIFKEQLCNPNSLKTAVQLKHDREIVDLRDKLGKDAIYSQFSKAMGTYLGEVIPHLIGGQLSAIPGILETYALFKLGPEIRYINYQTDKKTHYRASLINSEFGKRIQGRYNGFKTQLAHQTMGPYNWNSIVDFEHLFLLLFSSLVGKPQKDHKKEIDTVIQSLALSFSQQKKIDQFLKELKLTSEEEAFIGRLQWHQANQSLPRSLPNPHEVRLTSQNLPEELDIALNKYLEEQVTRFFEGWHPEKLEKGLLGVFYFLEGKDILIKLFTFLIGEFVIKQIADPHLFALAILSAGGVEGMGYELNGFGRYIKVETEAESSSRQTKEIPTRALILETGQQMMAEALSGNVSWQSLIEIFNKTGLRHAPNGLEAIMQKREAKEQLKKCIACMIYDIIKTNNFQHPETIFKNAREKAEQLPLLGAATLSLHVLVNGTLFSFGYLFQEDNQNNGEKISFPQWMIKNFAGKRGIGYLADRIVELIYHPSWRITLMQLIEKLLSSEPQQDSTDASIKKGLQEIINFIFKHFTEGSQLPFKSKIGSFISSVSEEKVYKAILEALKPKEPPFLEKVLTSFLPTIKELLLYTRVTDSFRKESVVFDGDAKFWEYFIRESLNQHVEIRISEQFQKPKQPTLAEVFAIRDQLVTEFLLLDQQELRKKLSTLPEHKMPLDKQSWVIVSNPVVSNKIDDEFFILNSNENDQNS